MIFSTSSEKETPINPNDQIDIYSVKSMVFIDFQLIDVDLWV